MGLKSMPMRRDFAQSIQLLEVLGLERIALDLLPLRLGVAGVEVQAMRAGQEARSALSRSLRSSSAVRALPG